MTNDLDTCVYFGDLIDQSYINSVDDWHWKPPTIYLPGQYTHVSGFNMAIIIDAFVPHDQPAEHLTIDGGRDADGKQIVVELILTDSEYSRNQLISTDLVVVGKWSDSKYFGKKLGKSDSFHDLAKYTDRLSCMEDLVTHTVHRVSARHIHLEKIINQPIENTQPPNTRFCVKQKYKKNS